jgi:hypothetical protein
LNDVGLIGRTETAQGKIIVPPTNLQTDSVANDFEYFTFRFGPARCSPDSSRQGGMGKNQNNDAGGKQTDESHFKEYV